MTTFRTGVCTWTFGDLPLEHIARDASVLGFDGVELLGELNRYTAHEAKSILSDAEMDVFSLTPTDADLAHPDPEVRAAGVDYYRRLIEFAAELDGPLVSCHGLVGRVAAITDQASERSWLAESVAAIAAEAKAHGIRVVFEVLNRYETHTIHTCREAADLIEGLGADNVGILLDAYHMNIEESDPAGAIREAGDRLWLYHAADSNRQALGRGHTDFRSQLAALESIGYTGPIILECTAPGPNPFTPIKDDRSLALHRQYLSESLRLLKS
ncbi:MAG TPA: sugar phosphate isomerase/epimerase [Anaerolineales bacterium]|nr:sugar phosphate isomerase/epimerase [Anaerolineales bacterium]